MVEKTAGGRTRMEIVARREAIERRHFEMWIARTHGGVRPQTPEAPQVPNTSLTEKAITIFHH